MKNLIMLFTPIFLLLLLNSFQAVFAANSYANTNSGTGINHISIANPIAAIANNRNKPDNRKTPAFNTEASLLLPTLRLQRVFPNISFTQPLALLPSPGNNARWYVLQKTGKIFWIDATDNNTTTKHSYIDLSADVNTASEGGVLSLAFHPNYINNRQVFISLTEPGGNGMRSTIVRYTENADGMSLDTASRQTVLTLNQPFNNHNGGQISFGPDGYLYIGFGDGGSANDPQNNSQNLNNWHGAMLRIDIDSATPYAVPPDNPFVSGSGLPEIYAFGLRNPWRWSFDSVTGQLWLADVGQDAFEEINIIEAGKNYGWRCREGDSVTNNRCNTSGPYTDPIAGYNHSEGDSITGGYVYRGGNIPGLYGAYLFADYINGKMWAITQPSADVYQRTLLLDSSLFIASFGQSSNGELFVVDFAGGGLHQIVPNVVIPDNRPPVARATATPLTGSASLVVNFDASTSSDPDADTLTYNWDFGDNNNASGISASHTYTTAGSYTATLTVSDGTLTNSTTLTITVTPPDSGSNVSCEYIIDKQWSSGFTALIRLTNNGSNNVDGWEVSWTFDDSSSVEQGWNALFSGSNPYTAVNAGWNRIIAPAATIEFGFNGVKGTANTPAPQPELAGPTCRTAAPPPTGKALYADQCARCHGATGDGQPILVPLNNPGTLSTGNDVAALAAYIAANMPSGNSGACDTDCANAVANYIAQTFWTDTPVTETPGPRQLSLLTRYEYTNTIEDLLGISTEAITANFPVEAKVNGFNNNATINLVTDRHIDEYMAAANVLANQAVAQNRAGLLPCQPTQPTCASQFIDSFGKKAFRRPLSADEKTAYLAIFNSESAFDDGMRLLIRAMLNSPQFLYKSEMGEPGAGGMYQLTAYEVATQLSYMFWGTLPDSVLFTAADNMQLANTTQIVAQAKRLLAHSRARKHMGHFAQQWLASGPEDIGTKDVNVYPNFSIPVRKAMTRELTTFFNHVLFDSTQLFTELFNANYVFANNTLAGYYNIPGVNGNEMQKVIDPSGKRGGLLTLGAVMAAHGHSNETAPVPRGKFVRRRIMCHQLPDPPTELDTSFPDPDPNLTTRERFELRTAAADCQDCHKYLNGVGFGFEAFDGTGALRTTDNGKPVNVMANVIGLETLSGTDSTAYDGAQQLQQLLIGSNTVKTCFARQFYRFSRGYAETGADQKTFDLLNQRFIDNNYNLQALMIAVTELASFTLRSER